MHSLVETTPSFAVHHYRPQKDFPSISKLNRCVGSSQTEVTREDLKFIMLDCAAGSSKTQRRKESAISPQCCNIDAIFLKLSSARQLLWAVELLKTHQSKTTTQTKRIFSSFSNWFRVTYTKYRSHYSFCVSKIDRR